MHYLYKLVTYIHKFDIDGKLKNLLPYKLYRFVCYMYTYLIFFTAGFRKLSKKNGELKGIGKGRRAFLLATGPSINKEDLKVLKNEDVFSLSNFFLHDDINIINPGYHFFVPRHKPLIIDNYIEWLKLADKSLPKGTKMILGSTIKHFVEKEHLFENREIIYIYLTPFTTNFSNMQLPVKIMLTGPQSLLLLLIYMGYSEIYLLGCDHNTLKTYDTERNDFYARDKDIRVNSTDKNAWNGIIEFLEVQLKVFKDYSKIKKLADKKGVKIYNLSEESRLETFEKKKLTDIL